MEHFIQAYEQCKNNQALNESLIKSLTEAQIKTLVEICVKHGSKNALNSILDPINIFIAFRLYFIQTLMKNNIKVDEYRMIINKYCSKVFVQNLIRDNHIDEFKYVFPEISYESPIPFVLEAIEMNRLDFIKFLVPKYVLSSCIDSFIDKAVEGIDEELEIVDYLKSIAPKKTKTNLVETFCKEHQIDLKPLPILAIEGDEVIYLMKKKKITIVQYDHDLVEEYSKRIDGLKYDDLIITPLGMKHLNRFVDEILNKDFLRDLLECMHDDTNDNDYTDEEMPGLCDSDEDNDSEEEEECKCESDSSDSESDSSDSESVVSRFSTISLNSPDSYVKT